MWISSKAGCPLFFNDDALPESPTYGLLSICYYSGKNDNKIQLLAEIWICFNIFDAQQNYVMFVSQYLTTFLLSTIFFTSVTSESNNLWLCSDFFIRYDCCYVANWWHVIVAYVAPWWLFHSRGPTGGPGMHCKYFPWFWTIWKDFSPWPCFGARDGATWQLWYARTWSEQHSNTLCLGRLYRYSIPISFA